MIDPEKQMKHSELKVRVFSVFPQIEISSIIRYGNYNGKDIDVFLLIKTNCSYNCWQNDLLDVTYVGGECFSKMMHHLDPIVTDPVLTGMEIFGDNLNFLKNIVLKTKANKDVPIYLSKASGIFLEWATRHMEKRNFPQAANALRFSISYLIFAKYYCANEKPIKYSQLIKKYPSYLLDEAMVLSKMAGNIDLKKLEELFVAVKNFTNRSTKRKGEIPFI